jgi:nicotinic acid phosphoribosyltransferase
MNECDLAGGFSAALFTDLYELTMAQAYDAEHMEDIAVFELSFRELSKPVTISLRPGLRASSRT